MSCVAGVISSVPNRCMPDALVSCQRAADVMFEPYLSPPRVKVAPPCHSMASGTTPSTWQRLLSMALNQTALACPPQRLRYTHRSWQLSVALYQTAPACLFRVSGTPAGMGSYLGLQGLKPSRKALAPLQAHSAAGVSRAAMWQCCLWRPPLQPPPRWRLLLSVRHQLALLWWTRRRAVLRLQCRNEVSPNVGLCMRP